MKKQSESKTKISFTIPFTRMMKAIRVGDMKDLKEESEKIEIEVDHSSKSSDVFSDETPTSQT